jgi:hypothetical protein
MSTGEREPYRSAELTTIDTYTLDKESTSYNDCFDAFRLALKYYAPKELKIEDETAEHRLSLFK